MSSRKAVWIIVTTFWSLFGLLTGLQVWMGMITHGHSVPRLVGYHVAVYGAWAPLTVLVVALARRWPIIPLRRRNILIHALTACVVGIVHIVHWLALLIWIRPFDRLTAQLSEGDVASIIGSRLPAEIIVYCAVLGAAQATDYYNKYRQRALETAQLQASLSSARLHALELQIQPHFLFNTLNAISSLVRSQRTSEAVVMIAGLSDLLRYTLDHAGDARVTLEEESAMLGRYLEIQRTRFPDRLTFGIDIPPDVRRAAVPTLILQPLAENAIRHGIARSAGSGTVNVRAFRDDGDLRIEIFNTGSLGDDREGIGLRNTRERLQQLYGNAQRFELRQVAGGVVAALAIPWAEIA